MLTPKQATQAVARNAFYGGYNYALVTNDGALLCTACVRENYRLIRKSTRDHLFNDWPTDGWTVIGLTHTGEMEETENCVHCDARIFTADE